jgi:predicted O-linked N-acetylglucosamine transferase (SPINDLY family)
MESRKINVGYLVSSETTGTTTRHLWQHLDKHRFNCNVYCSGPEPKAFGGPKPKIVDRLESDRLAKLVQDDGIDILVDLVGHGDGNRLDVMALKPAPVLLSYLGTPLQTDTGLNSVLHITDDYLKDKHHSPNARHVWFRETWPFVCYNPEGPVPLMKSYLYFKPTTSTVTFGYFGKLRNINASVIAAWKTILTRTPNSRLVLKSPYFLDRTVQRDWSAKFGELRDRLLLLKEMNPDEDRLDTYRMIDVHLDTFPSCDAVKTLESLYMNVPVITCVGTGAVQRTSGSILSSLGLAEDLVASNIIEYVAKATSMVNKLPHISVRKSFLAGKVTDIKGFMKNFENLLFDVYTETGTTRVM